VNICERRRAFHREKPLIARLYLIINLIVTIYCRKSQEINRVSWAHLCMWCSKVCDPVQWRHAQSHIAMSSPPHHRKIQYMSMQENKMPGKKTSESSATMVVVVRRRGEDLTQLRCRWGRQRRSGRLWYTIGSARKLIRTGQRW